MPVISPTYQLSDSQWAQVQDLLPANGRRGGQWKDHRLLIDGVLWALADGGRWRNVPERFGPWQTVYDRFRKWCRNGPWDRILRRLQARKMVSGEIDWRLFCIDGTVVRAHQSAAGAAKKKPAGSECNPVGVDLTPATRCATPRPAHPVLPLGWTGRVHQPSRGTVMSDNSNPEALPVATPFEEPKPDQPAKKPRSRRKPSEPEHIGDAVDQVLADVRPAGGDVFDRHAAQARAEEAQRAAQANGHGPNGEAEEPHKREWKQVVGYWRDNEAGVRMEEDRKNNLTTVLFRDKAPVAAKKALAENGYRREDDFAFRRRCRLSHLQGSGQLILQRLLLRPSRKE